jgi:hypothetical protein
MSHTIDRRHAKHIFLHAVELMCETGAPLLPRYLQLFFQYAEGKNQTLIDAVDKLLQQRAKPSPSELDLIFEQHFTDQVVNAGLKLHQPPEQKCATWLDLAGVKVRHLVGFRFVHRPA